ncbi:MAG: MOSC domain-containing protein [Nakamurella sp.]
MKADTTTSWRHGRHLTGRVRQLSIVVGGGRLPLTEARALSVDGFVGDEHPGGPDRAVTVHPWEHYAAWADDGRPAMVEPAFGEQLTSIGLLETELFVGDTFRWGTAEVTVGAPAVLDATTVEHLQVPGLIERMLRGGRTGFHLRVVRSGRVGPGDGLELIDVDPVGVSLATVGRALVDGPDAAGVTPQRLLLARDLLPAGLVAACERLLPAADQRELVDRRTAAG